MIPFLQYVAEDIIKKHGTNLTDVVVVFPNKRASLFMNQHLLKAAGRPLWSPSYVTISQLFRSKSNLVVADKIKSICVLYDVYKRFVSTEETLDRFWGWGEIMLADFDDLDKNMGNADLIFNNVSDLHAFDNVDFLDEEKRETLKKFFAEFTDSHDSRLKKRFEELWNQLSDIYHTFNEELKKQNIAYEGALYREVAERVDTLEWPEKKYVFVGFNMIQKVEQALFKSLKDKGQACFYWDFDRYYVDDERQEASRFINKWLVKFPNELDIKDKSVYGNFASHKDVTYISAATENIQARYITQWLSENNRMEAGKNTAIVLADESLLKSVIHYLPAELSGKVNITVGYPLSQTPIAALVDTFLALHIHAYNPQQQVYMLKQAENLLRHPYARLLSEQCLTMPDKLRDDRIFFPKPTELCVDEGTTLLFAPVDCPRSEMNEVLLSRLANILQEVGERSERERIANITIDGIDPDMVPVTYEEQFMQESVYQMHCVINRLTDLVRLDGLAVDPVTLLKLVDQIVGQTSMPFHGEPAVGLQIMGVLETRNLDFDHLLVLSCNEGNLPKGIDSSSLIPHSIRKAHELTTIDNKVAIYAYYFYRLLQRASDISIAYNSSTEDGNTGQMSRFMQQLMVEADPKIVTFASKSLSASQSPQRVSVGNVYKNEAVKEILGGMTYLSPSAINTYMRCPMLFYYTRVVGLREPDSDSIEDSRAFGTIFHDTAELMYKTIRTAQNEVTPQAIDALLNDKSHSAVYRLIDETFSKDFFKGRKPNYDGLQLINREVICRFIIKLLEADKQLAPFYADGLEVDAYTDLEIALGAETRKITVGGRIDRLDRIRTENGGQLLRVVDYKTGRNVQSVLEGVDEVFNSENIDKQHSDYYLQAMLYSMIVRDMATPYVWRGETLPALNKRGLPVSPALLFIQNSESVNDPILKFKEDGSESSIMDIKPYQADFQQHLEQLIQEILNPETPFARTTKEDRCNRCAFLKLCKGK